jgi:hypothetical protein
MAKTIKAANQQLTATNLKNVLWETLNKVKDGEMDAGAADSIATQSREIMRTINIQLSVARQTKRQVPMEIIEFSEKSANGQ